MPMKLDEVEKGLNVSNIIFTCFISLILIIGIMTGDVSFG